MTCSKRHELIHNPAIYRALIGDSRCTHQLNYRKRHHALRLNGSNASPPYGSIIECYKILNECSVNTDECSCDIHDGSCPVLEPLANLVEHYADLAECLCDLARRSSNE